MRFEARVAESRRSAAAIGHALLQPSDQALELARQRLLQKIGVEPGEILGDAERFADFRRARSEGAVWHLLHGGPTRRAAMRFSVAAKIRFQRGCKKNGNRPANAAFSLTTEPLPIQRATMRTDKLPGEPDQASGIFMLGLVLGASVPLFFLALG